MEGNIVSLDWTLFVQAVNFLVFMVLINKFLFKPLLSLMDERESELSNYHRETEKIKQRVSDIMDEYEKLLAQAKERSKEIVSGLISEAKLQREKIVLSAQEEARKKIESAKKSIWKSFEEEKARLEKETEAIAGMIVEKLLGRKAA